MVHVGSIRSGLVVVAVGGAIGLAGAAALPAGGRDYSAVPPPAAEVEAMLRKKPIDLAGAMEAARKKIGGVVASASFDLERSAESVQVVVFAKRSKHRVVVDATSGRVVSDDIVPRFPGEPVEGEWTELPSGLKYYDIVEGGGAQPAGSSSTVLVHYSGWLVDGTKFDSSVDRGQALSFQLGRVIPGWTEGVGSMKIGGKRKLIIPYKLAYGEAGRAPVIPPRATLIFDVELLDIVGEPATPPRE